MYTMIKLPVKAAFCDCCHKDLHSYEGWPYIDTGEKQYCEACALKCGALSPLEYVNKHECTTRRYYEAEIKDGYIYAKYKCRTKKGYRTDKWGPIYEELQ